MQEMKKLELNLIFQNKEAQIWTGDFKSLTKTYYDEEAWEDISRVRKRASNDRGKKIH